ncbi:hypothetical protein BCR33DRAFT_782465 [Rhizoclosmatium globosum]|uniref:P-loop containing nucleoside triphosphate hydrolase protein n=1 Tax=Rhizoclosmatium globosum TaxID=329046 RepID=A0A1Y2CMA1_9FUNG|nr:hypothetical protein BCR33DRAFT_782465 [Rhizoclosmatium globosum]|eukprot:ORY48056.1 hypothetical protein BCR33DRAFT_782465 [Rhizoclosmatium globosum]
MPEDSQDSDDSQYLAAMSPHKTDSTSNLRPIKLTPWSFLTVSWMDALVIFGAKKDLVGADLPSLPLSDTVDGCLSSFDQYKAKHPHQSLDRVVYAHILLQYAGTMCVAGILMLLSLSAGLGVPLILQQILDLVAFKDVVPESMWSVTPLPDTNGFPLFTLSNWTLAGILIALKIASTVFGRLHDTIVKRVAFQLRTFLYLCCDESVDCVATEVREFSKGQILNLINVDTENIVIFVTKMHELWGTLFEIVVAVCLIWRMIGFPLVAGIGVLASCLVVLTVAFIPFYGSIQLMRIRLLKCQVLVETAFKNITTIRNKQLSLLNMFTKLIIFGSLIAHILSAMMPLASFSLYAARGNIMSSTIIFPALALFQMLAAPMINFIAVLAYFSTASFLGNRRSEARIALARAIYSDADIILLDDPLAPLDARVSHSVLQETILTALKNKTVVMTTHNHKILEHADSILFINNSGQVSQHTYSEFSKSDDHHEDSEVSDIVVAEDMEVGKVKLTTYAGYVKASGGWGHFIVMAAFIGLYQATVVLMNQWLTWWCKGTLDLGTTARIMWYISVKNLHENALISVLAAPMSWWEGQLIGRLMNRFTKDIQTVENQMILLLMNLSGSVGWLVSVWVILAINTPVLLAFFIPLGVLYLGVLWYFPRTFRQLKRLEATQRSPLYSHISEMFAGVSTIVSSGGEAYWVTKMKSLLEESNQPLFFKFGAEVWILLRLELISALLVLWFVSSDSWNIPMFTKEDALTLESDPSDDEWPKTGTIVFRDVSAFYHSSPNVPALKNISLMIEPGSRLNTLRAAFEVVPQDTTLLSGTIRTWLDPLSTHTDAELWDSVSQAGLHPFLTSLNGLDTLIEENGIHFLSGSIVLLDEATSSVDPETENLLRRLMKEKLRGTTFLTVLHRLQESVLDDYDKVLVLDQGLAVEFESPRLFELRHKIFNAYGQLRALCANTSIAPLILMAWMQDGNTPKPRKRTEVCS